MQLAQSLEDAEPKLKRAYDEKDFERFNQIKSFMLKLQTQIARLLEK